jgi:hypothetical protein
MTFNVKLYTVDKNNQARPTGDIFQVKGKNADKAREAVVTEMKRRGLPIRSLNFAPKEEILVYSGNPPKTKVLQGAVNR